MRIRKSNMETTALKMFTETILYKDSKIWVKPVCDFFQIDAKYQYQKIKNDPILGCLVEKSLPDLGEIDEKGRIFLTQKGFIRWIQTINSSIIKKELRDKFIVYQNMIFDFLMGSFEEHEIITLVNHELQLWKERYSEAGTMIRKKQAELTLLLNSRYQYRIEFKQTKILTQ